MEAGGIMTTTTPEAPAIWDMAQEEHRQAELLRLDLGMAGCGCSSCQNFYRSLDLSKYGKRVHRYDEAIYITGRMSPGDPDDGAEDHPETAHDSPRSGNLGRATTEQVSTEVPTEYVSTPQAQPTPDVVDDTPGIMAQTPAAQVPKKRRDRPQRPTVPVERIHELHQKGNTTRRIAELLTVEGVAVSFRTVARVLSGERPL